VAVVEEGAGDRQAVSRPSPVFSILPCAKLSVSKTMDILMKGRGSHFDPDILDVFMKIS
jgi:hypothetical protein